MIYYLDLVQVLDLHADVLRMFGGIPGIRDQGLIESAVAQPEATFGGQDLYPTLVDKGVALAFSLAKNHGFLDGNKRIAYAAMDTFFRANGYRIPPMPDDAEAAVIGIASGMVSRDDFAAWVRTRLAPLPP